MFDLSELPAPVYDGRLPSMLQRVVELLPAGAWQKRFASLYRDAAAAMQALGELDFSRFEADDEGEQPYEVWQQLAPVVAHTLDTVHHLLQTTEAHFAAYPCSIDSQLDTAVAVVHDFRHQVQQEVDAFRDGSQKAENMANRWRLLGYLSYSRGRFRAAIGNMIFASATVFAKVNKADVVPFYRDDIEAAITLRRCLSELQRASGLFEAGRRPAQPIIEPAVRLLAALERFQRSDGYSYMRVLDRRMVVHTRAALEDQIDRTDEAALQRTVSEFRDFLTSLSAINERDTLVVHDQTALQQANACIANATEALRAGVVRARIEVESALKVLDRLEGRDPVLDRLLASLNACPLDSLDLGDLASHIDVLAATLRRASS